MSETWNEIWKRQDDCLKRLEQVTAVYDSAVAEFKLAVAENQDISECIDKVEKANFDVSIELYEKMTVVTKENETNKRFVTASNAIHDVQAKYFNALFAYINMITDDREKLFSSEYIDKINNLSDKGYFLQYIRTPFDVPPEILNSEDTLCEYYYASFPDITKKIFEDNLDSKHNLTRVKVCDYRYSLESLYNGNYNSCARTMFALLENDHKNSSGLTKSRTKGYDREVEVTKRISKIGVKWYIDAWDKINNFYKKITCNTNKWDKTEINRNDLVHGTYERETTRNDCIKLILMYTSFKELSMIIRYMQDFFDRQEALNGLLAALAKYNH